MKDNDAIFKEIAKTYVDNLGEKAKLENEKQHIALDTKMLDKKFAEKLKTEKLGVKEQKESGQKIRKFAKALMQIAACFVIVCILVAVQSNLGPATEAPPAEEAAIEEVEAEEPALEAPIEEASPTSEQIIPLPALSENLRIVSQEMVNGVSIYHLQDEQANDIIIEMEYGQIDGQETTDMQEEQINGHTIYQEDTESRKRIIFDREGIVYTLTNDNDISILLAICEQIL